MIKHLKHNEIDKIRWDDCIEKSINGTICAYSWFLDVICQKWEALVEGDYESVFPLTAGKKYSIDYLYQPFFTQQLGLFSVNPLSEDILRGFLNNIPARYKFIDICLNTTNTLLKTEFTLKKHVTFELNLNNPYGNLSKNYAKGTRSNIKKAITNKLRIDTNAPSEEIINLFRNNKGRSLRRIKHRHYTMLKELIYKCLQNKSGQSWGVYTKENILCAGAFFIESHHKIILNFLATDATAKLTGAASYLIDGFIKKNSERDMIFDFEGSNRPGLAYFYKSFGSSEKTYLNIRRNNLPWFIKWVKG